MTENIKVTDFPSHSAAAEQAWQVVRIDPADPADPMGRRLLGIVERYPDGSFHLGGRRTQRYGWISFKRRRDAVEAIVTTDGLGL